MLLDAAGRRFTDELAPRDQVTAAILDRMEADGSDYVWLDMRQLDPGRFPNVFATCVEAGPGPDRTAGAGLPRVPLPDRGNRLGSRRPHDPRRPARRRRVLLHRPPRRQPPRLQLAQRVLRLRHPRGARCARAHPAGRALPRRRAGASPRPPRPPARRFGRTPAPSATRAARDLLARRSVSAGRDDRGQRARAP